MKKYIPYGEHWIDEDDVISVAKALTDELLTTGPKIERFEQKIAEFTGSKYAIALSNGTAALHAACFAAGIANGDEVIVTPMTFAATSNAVLYCGGKPVFADINPKTYNIDPGNVEKLISEKTKAIIPVHYTGQPCAMDEILEIADRYNLIVIEDAAHAIGASYKGRPVGSIGDMTTFSFHPVKNMTTGEGGIVVTNSEEFYKKMMQFRVHGITKNKEEMFRIEGPWYYEQQFLGYNYRLTDIQAALGLSQLNKLKKFNARRRKIAEIYTDAFMALEGIILPYQLHDTISSWHLYVVQLELEKLKSGRCEIFDALREEGIGVHVHYIPVYYHPYYQKLGYKRGICPNAERLYERIITLPLYPKMSDNDVEYVIYKVKKVIKERLK